MKQAKKDERKYFEVTEDSLSSSLIICVPTFCFSRENSREMSSYFFKIIKEKMLRKDKENSAVLIFFCNFDETTES